jgi:hypothetical protein
LTSRISFEIVDSSILGIEVERWEKDCL